LRDLSINGIFLKTTEKLEAISNVGEDFFIRNIKNREPICRGIKMDKETETLVKHLKGKGVVDKNSLLVLLNHLKAIRRELKSGVSPGIDDKHILKSFCEVEDFENNEYNARKIDVFFDDLKRILEGE
jgi:hypothetical protein